jgi:hypothetical protein
MLGTAKKVTIDKDNTTVVSGAEADMIKIETKSKVKWKLQLLIMTKKNYRTFS